MDSGKKTVLLVEDDPFLSDIYLTSLEHSGIKTIHADNGNKALLEIKKGGFNLILLDLLLPGIDGFTILEEIKKINQIEKIPIIVLSNLMDSKKIERAKKLGAKEYLLKTKFEPKDIVEKVRKYLK